MHKTQQRIDYRLEIKVTVIMHRASGNVQDADLIAALLIAFLIVKFSLLHFYLATYHEMLSAIQRKKEEKQINSS